MDRDQIRAGVLASLAEIAPEVDAATLQPARALRRQVDLDSMDWQNVIVDWHRRFGVDIPEADYPKVRTLEGFLGYLHTKLAA